MWFLIGAGAIGAGLLLALRELLPWMEANRTGRIRTRGDRAQTVLRDEDPERFKALLKKRFNAAGPGALFVIGGVVWLAWNLLGLLMMAAA
ncbi:hypothetical protein [Brevundimonas sp.]|uniref:hypothetical protein n=1 Tax=Brevundimonas sp. TaxID=1871086 RepID=UPI003F70A46F